MNPFAPGLEGTLVESLKQVRSRSGLQPLTNGLMLAAAR